MDVTKEAYDKAINLIGSDKKSKGTNLHRFQSVYKIEDVLDAVKEAQLKYVARKGESKIMDMMSQHHPEYVSLAWDTMKLLFILVLNHEEMISELAKAVSKIGDVLTRVKLQLETFRIMWMQEAAQALYVDIINFFVRSLKWYESSPLKNAWMAFKDPYKLHFQDLRDKIDEGARRMDDMANYLSHAKISEIQQMVMRIEGTLSAHHLVYLARFSGLDRSMHEVQVAQILDATKDTPFPSPIESLRFCQAVRRKRIEPFELDRSILFPKLREWSNAPSSSLITIVGSAPTRFQTKDLTTEMVGLIEAAKKPVIWALKGRQPVGVHEVTHTDLLKQLVNQVIAVNNKRMVQKISANYNAPRVGSAATEADWLEIPKEGLTGLTEVYLIVDMEILGRPTEDEGKSWFEFFRYFESLVGSIQGVAVKVAILSFRQDFARTVSLESPSVPLVPHLPITSSWMRLKMILTPILKNPN